MCTRRLWAGLSSGRPVETVVTVYWDPFSVRVGLGVKEWVSLPDVNPLELVDSKVSREKVRHKYVSVSDLFPEREGPPRHPCQECNRKWRNGLRVHTDTTDAPSPQRSLLGGHLVSPASLAETVGGHDRCADLATTTAMNPRWDFLGRRFPDRRTGRVLSASGMSKRTPGLPGPLVRPERHRKDISFPSLKDFQSSLRLRGQLKEVGSPRRFPKGSRRTLRPSRDPLRAGPTQVSFSSAVLQFQLPTPTSVLPWGRDWLWSTHWNLPL